MHAVFGDDQRLWRGQVEYLSRRGITRNLVDCSADLLNDPSMSGEQINGANALDGAAKLCKAYGIAASSAVADLGMAIPSFQTPLATRLTRSSRAWHATLATWSTSTCSTDSCWTASAHRRSPGDHPG
jgi:prophage tail gpP-like protein